MMDFIHDHENLLLWLAVVSFLVFIASLLLIPWIVTKIPSDYFTHPKRPKYLWDNQPNILRYLFLFLKNILGVMLVLGGFTLLFLPGQGIVTMMIGLLIMDFPYKYKVEIWIVKHPVVLRSINRFRKRAKQPPLEI